jgi:2-octaprenyl-6-methoxyphenol hydroxylase
MAYEVMMSTEAQSGSHMPGSQMKSADVIIVGGSYVGLTLALALVDELGPDVTVAVVDRGAGLDVARATSDRDPRASAISAASRNLLKALGLWAALEDDATPVTSIELTDSSLKAGVRRPLLTYDNELPSGTGSGAAAFIVPNARIAAALAAKVSATPAIDYRANAIVTGFATLAGLATISLHGGSTLRAPLVIAADGRRSSVRELAGIQSVGWDHDQNGIVTAIRHEYDHGNRAVQHFLPGGPFAILPLRGGRRSCLTWSEKASETTRILALSDGAFLDEVDMRVAGRLGAVTLDGPRKSWSLETHLARRFVAPRLALVGDAAHCVHPIAGQGLNLGFRDVAALVECISDAARVGLEFGDADALQRYERWRRFDTALSTAAFSGLNRMFSNDFALARSVREVGLGIVDRLPGLKRMLVTEAAGLTGDVPKLLRSPSIS